MTREQSVGGKGRGDRMVRAGMARQILISALSNRIWSRVSVAWFVTYRIAVVWHGAELTG